MTLVLWRSFALILSLLPKQTQNRQIPDETASQLQPHEAGLAAPVHKSWSPNCVRLFRLDASRSRAFWTRRLSSAVFTHYVARALIFSTKFATGPFSQTGLYSSTCACYFQSKVMLKNYPWRQTFHDINLLSVSIFSRLKSNSLILVHIINMK